MEDFFYFKEDYSDLEDTQQSNFQSKFQESSVFSGRCEVQKMIEEIQKKDLPKQVRAKLV
jgi:hypothetical protein